MKYLVVLLVAAGVAFAADDSPEPKLLAAVGGRFVFGQVNSLRADQYMLDTLTGRLWRMVQLKDGSMMLEPIAYSMLGNKKALNAPTEEADLDDLDAAKKSNSADPYAGVGKTDKSAKPPFDAEKWLKENGEKAPVEPGKK